MRLVDADKLVKARPFQVVGGPIGNYTEGFVDCAEEARETIKNAPTIDAVPVVRCRDCKNLCVGGVWFGDARWGCKLLKVSVDLDFFCGFGQRKNEVPDED